MLSPPKVFVSYPHDSSLHKKWVKDLAIYLRNNGVNIILDQWDLSLGSDLASFMDQGLGTSDRVLLILTDNYINKSNKGTGGVGYEKMITSLEILNDQTTSKFIPVVRDVCGESKLPIFLGARLYIDLSKEDNQTEQRLELLKEIHKAQELKPPN